MSVNYFLENGKIAIARYKVTHTSKTGINGGVTCTTGALFKSKNDYASYVKNLEANSIKYDVTVFADEEIAPYLQYEGLEVGAKEAEHLLDPDPESLLRYKTNQMNEMCNKTILAGLDIVLSDGAKKHFSLTEKDQINLLGLTMQASTGIFNDTGVPYHADGEECELYSITDFNLISAKCFAYKTYHTTYVNQIKSYLRELAANKDIIKMHLVTYGMELPTEYMDKMESLLNVIQGASVL